MDKKEFALRRTNLAQHLLPGSVALLWAARPKMRNGDVHHIYRQESNFYYLTKFSAEDSVCVITKDLHNNLHTTLIIPDVNLEKALWDGPLQTPSEIIKYYGVEEVIYYAQQEQYIAELISQYENLYFDYMSSAENQRQVFAWIKKAQTYAQRCHISPHIHDLGYVLKQLRYIKTSYEINLMRKACQISAKAHKHLMSHAKIGISEHDLELDFRRYCLNEGLIEMAYPPIVAGGKNACVLHYRENNKVIHSGDLVLIDAGAECEYYAADITRTWPINGKFSSAQKAIYEIVLSAQLAGINKAVSGNNWEDIHLAIVNILVRGLIDCKLLTGSIEENIATQAYRKYYMHSFGHWLGIDTHDEGIWRFKHNNHLEWQKLVPNMVLTMEPGIYITEHADIDPMWHNIGIRIEDDILITDNGNEVLSEDAPKSIEEIEQLHA